MRPFVVSLCIFILSFSMSGCIWGTVAIVGAAVVGANIDEFQRSQEQTNSTEALDEHLAHQKKVDEAMKGSSGEQVETIDTEEVIDTYGGKIIDD